MLIQEGGTYTPGSLQQMQHLAGHITTNAHSGGNRFEENDHCAVGMWPALSCFNHSCSPNVWHWAEGRCLCLSRSCCYDSQVYGASAGAAVECLATGWLPGASQACLLCCSQASSRAESALHSTSARRRGGCCCNSKFWQTSPEADSVCVLGAGPVQHVHVVRTVQPGEQLFVHYVSLHEPRLVRQMRLLREKHFTCGCQRCLVPMAESPDRFLEVGNRWMHLPLGLRGGGVKICSKMHNACKIG